jgi:hypothetical protein
MANAAEPAEIPASTADAYVGLIELRSGHNPEDAFIVERGGVTIVPQSFRTPVIKNDVIRPQAGVQLLFIPYEANCGEPEMISRSFTVKGCNEKEKKGITERVYDVLSDEFLSSKDQEVPAYVTRGKTYFSLPLNPLSVLVQGTSAPDVDSVLGWIHSMPFIRLVHDEKAQPDMIVQVSERDIFLTGNYAGTTFPRKGADDPARLRTQILRYVNVHALVTQKKFALPEGVAVTVNLFAKDKKSGVPTIQGFGRRWFFEKSIHVSPSNLNQSIAGEMVATFVLKNNTATDWYVYIVNCTNEGMIQALLGQTLLKAHDKLDPSDLVLSLTSPVEYVLFLVTETSLPSELSSRRTELGLAVEQMAQAGFRVERNFPRPAPIPLRLPPDNLIGSALLRFTR